MKHWSFGLGILILCLLVGCSSQETNPPEKPAPPVKQVKQVKQPKQPVSKPPKVTPTSSPAKADKKALCQKDKGCAPVKTIPKCSTKLIPQPLEKVLDRRNTLIGKTVSVVGPFKKQVGCTEMACSIEMNCCNTCSGEVFLGPIPGPGYTTLYLKDTKDPNHFACSGDDSLSCCPYEATGQKVIATGKIISHNGGFAVENPKLCLP